MACRRSAVRSRIAPPIKSFLASMEVKKISIDPHCFKLCGFFVVYGVAKGVYWNPGVIDNKFDSGSKGYCPNQVLDQNCCVPVTSEQSDACWKARPTATSGSRDCIEMHLNGSCNRYQNITAVIQKNKRSISNMLLVRVLIVAMDAAMNILLSLFSSWHKCCSWTA